jgi:hypothetical protein
MLVSALHDRQSDPAHQADNLHSNVGRSSSAHKDLPRENERGRHEKARARRQPDSEESTARTLAFHTPESRASSASLFRVSLSMAATAVGVTWPNSFSASRAEYVTNGVVTEGDCLRRLAGDTSQSSSSSLFSDWGTHQAGGNNDDGIRIETPGTQLDTTKTHPHSRCTHTHTPIHTHAHGPVRRGPR